MIGPSYRQLSVYVETVAMVGVSLIGAAVLLRLVYHAIFR